MHACTRRFLRLLLFGLIGLGASCSKSPVTVEFRVSTAHEHRAPHGGTPVVLGDESYHLELVRDADAGKLTAYVLDGEMDNFIRLRAPAIEIVATVAGEKRPLALAAVANSATGETIAGFEKENLADQIRLEVVRAAQNYRTARAKIQVSVKAIAQSEEALRIIHDRYDVGLTTFAEVLQAEAMLVRSKFNLLRARYEYLISYAAVLLATGRLTDAGVFE